MCTNSVLLFDGEWLVPGLPVCLPQSLLWVPPCICLAMRAIRAAPLPQATCCIRLVMQSSNSHDRLSIMGCTGSRVTHSEAIWHTAPKRPYGTVRRLASPNPHQQPGNQHQSNSLTNNKLRMQPPPAVSPARVFWSGGHPRAQRWHVAAEEGSMRAGGRSCRWSC